MSYPFPTIDKPRAANHVCILPHKMYGIDTYAQCVAAMQGCRDVAAARYERNGDATQAHFAQLFHMAANADTLLKVDSAATAADAGGGRNDWDYHGVCRTLLSDCGRTNLWPMAREATARELQRFHAQQPPTSMLGAPTLSCYQKADGTFECRSNGAQRATPAQSALSTRQSQPFALQYW